MLEEPGGLGCRQEEPGELGCRLVVGELGCRLAAGRGQGQMAFKKGFPYPEAEKLNPHLEVKQAHQLSTLRAQKDFHALAGHPI
jgi:hypothetical protein